MKRIVAVLALMSVFALPAAAADVYYKAPVYKKYNWTGWYAGVDAGYFDGKTVNTPLTAGIFPNADLSGGYVGLNVGYRWHMANDWVYGLQLNAPIYAKKQRPVVAIAGQQNGELNWALYGTGQIGKAYGRWLPYVEAGLGVADAEGLDQNSGITTSNTHFMYTLGLGVNYALTDRITTGLKYQYIGTSKERYPSGVSAADWGFEMSLITFNLGYRF
jgi:outer membrane immunogenic protein